MTDIGKRKQDHIELALKSEHQSKADSSFDGIRFEHNALPEISLSDINLSCEFLNHELAAPLIKSPFSQPPVIAPIIRGAASS